jgi:uncharacterized membrane protein YqaE (UPF0057 family)
MRGTVDFVSVLLSALLPPVAVFLQVGIGLQFWVNLVLCCFFWVPGQVHALYVTAHKGRSAEEGMTTFVALLVALFIPPIAVALKRGVVSLSLVINVVLCFVFWFPAVLHALWVATHD